MFSDFLNHLETDDAIAANMAASLLLKMAFISILSLESKILQSASEKKVSDSRKEFLRYVFHEVRVPLNTITMGISILKDDIIVSQQDVVSMMDNAAGFMNDTLNDVLSMSKIEDGDMALHLKPFKLDALIDSVLHKIKSKADQKSIHIIKDDSGAIFASNKTHLIGDQAKLKHVVINFLKNAIKFSAPDSTIVLSVINSQKTSFMQSVSESFVTSVSRKRDISRSYKGAKRSRVSPQGQRHSYSNEMRRFSITSMKEKISKMRSKSPKRPVTIKILVVDNGIGVDAEVQRKLFHAFAQIRPHDKESDGRGSGLGLVIAKRVVTLHGGKIIFSSEAGKGSTFGFSIPFQTTEKAYLSGRFPALESFASSIKSVAFNIPNVLRSSSSKSALHPRGPRNTGDADTTIGRLKSKQNSFVGRSANESNAIGSSFQSSVSMTCLHDEALMEDEDIKIIQMGEIVQIRSVTGQLVYGQLVKMPSRAVTGASSVTEPCRPVIGMSCAGSFKDRRLRFLLVDDTASNCKMLKMLLRRKGIDSDIAYDGQAAVDLYKVPSTDAGARRPAVHDVIFMDHTMPVMSGIEATSIIRSLGYTGLIIGLTGNALDDDVDAFLKAGADCVTLKPFREEHLNALLDFLTEHGCESNPKIKKVMRHTAIKFQM